MLRLIIVLVLTGVVATVLSLGTYALTGGADMDVGLFYHPSQNQMWRKIGPIYFIALWVSFFSTILLGYILICSRRKKK